MGWVGIRVLGLVFLGLALGTGCGASEPGLLEPTAPPSSTPIDTTPTNKPAEPEPTATAPPEGWAAVRLAPYTSETHSAVASLGNTAVIVHGGAAFVSSDGATNWSSAQLHDDESTLAVAAAIGEVGIVIATSSLTAGHVPKVHWSPDGLSWTEVSDQPAFEGPADPSSIVVAADAVVMGGAARNPEQPSSGPFTPVVWHSRDARSWDRIDLPVRREGSVRAVALVDAELVAIGRDGNRLVIWRSADGTVWSEPDPVLVDEQPSTVDLHRLASADGRLVAVGGRGLAPVVLTSTDGVHWTSIDLDEALVAGSEPLSSLGAGPGGFWALTEHRLAGWRDPGRCYGDPNPCDRGAWPLALASPDGLDWRMLDLSGFGDATGGALEILTDLGDGRLLGIGIADGDLTAWTWGGGDPFPELDPAALEGPDPPPEPLATGAEPLELGVRYRYPLDTHCGLDVLGLFDGRWWFLDRQAHNPPPGVPLGGMLHGYIEKPTGDRIEYYLDDDLIAVYSPSDEQPPDCI